MVKKESEEEDQVSLRKTHFIIFLDDITFFNSQFTSLLSKHFKYFARKKEERVGGGKREE